MPQPGKFFTDSPPPRIIGTEMEYDSRDIFTYISDNSYTKDLLLPQGIRSAINGSGVFTSNGARIYPDVNHVEYASAESLGPLEAAFTDHAGMLVIEGMRKQLAHRWETDTPFDPPQRRSGTFDPEDPEEIIATKGYHENYCVPPYTQEQRAIFRFVFPSYLVTRQLWNGNGFAAHTYTMSQKASGIGDTVTEGVDQATIQGHKAMVAYHDGPNDKAPEWSIAEVRFADPSMFPHITYLSLATASLTLRLIEQGKLSQHNFHRYSLARPLVVKDNLSRSVSDFQKREYSLLDERGISAVALQGRLATLALDMIENDKVKLPADEVRAAYHWYALCERLASAQVMKNNFESLVGDVEWATKYHFMRKRVTGELSGYNKPARSFDLQWTSTDERSIGRIIAGHINSPIKNVDKKIAHYATQPPRSTRAHVRGGLIANRDVKYVISWSAASTSHNIGEGHTIELDDPYQTRV